MGSIGKLNIYGIRYTHIYTCFFPAGFRDYIVPTYYILFNVMYPFVYKRDLNDVGICFNLMRIRRRWGYGSSNRCFSTENFLSGGRFLDDIILRPSVTLWQLYTYIYKASVMTRIKRCQRVLIFVFDEGFPFIFMIN